MIAASLGWFSVTASLAQIMVKGDAALALRLAPYDGAIAAKLAQQTFEQQPDSAVASRPARMARQALRREPAVTEALIVLGLQAQLRDDTEGARDVFHYALKLSRRALQPRLWAIEEAVARGDIVGALSHYDIALRSSKTAPALLYPTLASALSEPRVRIPLLELMMRRPGWEGEFIAYAARNAPDVKIRPVFLTAAGRAGLPVTSIDRAATVNALAAEGSYTEAWKFYDRASRVDSRHGSRDPVFATASSAAAPSGEANAVFDWTLATAPGLSATFQRQGGTKGVLDYAFAPSVGGPVVQQLQLLPPGDYRLSGYGRVGPQDPKVSPYWTLVCSDGRALGRVGVPVNAAGARFAGAFTVPPGCSVQTLLFVARPSDALEGANGQIERVALMPVDGG